MARIRPWYCAACGEAGSIKDGAHNEDNIPSLMLMHHQSLSPSCRSTPRPIRLGESADDREVKALLEIKDCATAVLLAALLRGGSPSLRQFNELDRAIEVHDALLSDRKDKKPCPSCCGSGVIPKTGGYYENCAECGGDRFLPAGKDQ